MRYLNVLFAPKKGDIYKHSFKEYALPRTRLKFGDSKLEELFEMADKAEYLAASMLEIDLAELSSTDNFKENYTYTVIKQFC